MSDTIELKRVDGWVTDVRIIVLLASVIAISGLHFITGVSTSEEHLFHVLFRLGYFIPLMLAALWFGVRGGAWLSLVCCLLLTVHIVVSWSGNVNENINQAAMIVLFPFIGIGFGFLIDRERAERDRRHQQKSLAQRRTVIESISSLSAALNAKDSYTRDHSEDVATLAKKIGGELGLSDESLDRLYLSGIAHDIGKIGLKDDVLFKPADVTAEEMVQIRRHPEIAAAILRPISGASRIAELVLCHHEQLDGSGYPRGLKGEDIPLEARILTVADIYSALIDERPYSRGMRRQEALSTLHTMSGDKVDETVVRVLERVVGAVG